MAVGDAPGLSESAVESAIPLADDAIWGGVYLATRSIGVEVVELPRASKRWRKMGILPCTTVSMLTVRCPIK